MDGLDFIAERPLGYSARRGDASCVLAETPVLLPKPTGIRGNPRLYRGEPLSAAAQQTGLCAGKSRALATSPIPLHTREVAGSKPAALMKNPVLRAGLLRRVTPDGHRRF